MGIDGKTLTENNNTVQDHVKSLMEGMIAKAKSQQQAIINSIGSLEASVSKIARELGHSSSSPTDKVCYSSNTHTHNHFTALWTLSGTTWVSWYQKVTFHHLLDFLMQHRQTHQQSRWTAISAIPTIFMTDAQLGKTLPIYPGMGQAPNMLACIPDDCKQIVLANCA